MDVEIVNLCNFTCNTNDYFLCEIVIDDRPVHEENYKPSCQISPEDFKPSCLVSQEDFESLCPSPEDFDVTSYSRVNSKIEEEFEELKEEQSSALENDFADLLCLTDYEKQLATAFESPDVALVFCDNEGKKEKLYVKKEQLSKVSPVFSAMFSPNFKEASADAISLPGKKLSTFIHFLRLALPGHVDELRVDIAHAVLPYVDEYQAEELKIKIDKFLSTEIRKSEHNTTNCYLVENIVEAEKYALHAYLEACIYIATRRKSKCLVSELLYDKISKETRLQIAHLRLKSLENLYEDNICIKSQEPSYKLGLDGRYKLTKPVIVDWKHEYLNTNPPNSTPSARCRELLMGIKERFSVFMTE